MAINKDTYIKRRAPLLPNHIKTITIASKIINTPKTCHEKPLGISVCFFTGAAFLAAGFLPRLVVFLLAI